MCIRDRENAVSGNQLDAGALLVGGLELSLEVFHVVVFVAEALGLAQANTVDDAGVVELVRDDGVFGRQKGLKPVSYTHLDVYKRQMISLTLPAGKL